MALQLIAAQRSEAEIYEEPDLCKQKSVEVLREFGLPRGLMPLNHLVEVGMNRTTGFIWMKQKKSTEHRFKDIGKSVMYEPEVTAFIEDGRMRKVTGVKSKELLFWVKISDIFVGEENPDEITFANPTGLSKTYPVHAFDAEDA